MSAFQFIPYYVSARTPGRARRTHAHTHTHTHTHIHTHTHTHTHTHIYIPFEDREPAGLKVNIAPVNTSKNIEKITVNTVSVNSYRFYPIKKLFMLSSKSQTWSVNCNYINLFQIRGTGSHWIFYFPYQWSLAITHCNHTCTLEVFGPETTPEAVCKTVSVTE